MFDQSGRAGEGLGSVARGLGFCGALSVGSRLRAGSWYRPWNQSVLNFANKLFCVVMENMAGLLFCTGVSDWTLILHRDLIPPGIQIEYLGVPRLYKVYYALNFGPDSFVEVWSNFRCIRGTSKDLI